MIENQNVICNDCGFGKQNKELEERCERLEKQLAIAVEALEKYANGTDTTTETDEEGNKYEYEYPLTNDDGETAIQALQQIKDLEK